jgi:hypothetical protein
LVRQWRVLSQSDWRATTGPAGAGHTVSADFWYWGGVKSSGRARVPWRDWRVEFVNQNPGIAPQIPQGRQITQSAAGESVLALWHFRHGGCPRERNMLPIGNV